jgi:hypothetical protein
MWEVLQTAPMMLAGVPPGAMRGFLILLVLAIACLGLAAKAFSAKGLPFTRTTYITGKPAKAIGIIVGAAGIALLIFVIVGFIGVSSEAP